MPLRARPGASLPRQPAQQGQDPFPSQEPQGPCLGLAFLAEDHRSIPASLSVSISSVLITAVV